MKKKQSEVFRFTSIKPLTNVILNIIMIILCIACLLPLVLVLSISLTAEDSLRQYGYQLFPRALSFQGYTYLWMQRAVILPAFGVSVFITVFGTALGVVLNSLMGYILSRREYKLQKFFTWFVFVPMVFNGGLVATYFIISEFLGLRNTLAVLILPLAVSSFNVILCKTFFRATIPDSVIESAKIDGASQMAIFFRIVFPLSLPVLATIGLFLSFAYWNDWFTAMLYIDDPRLFSLQAYLNRLLNDINFLAQNAAMLGMTQAELIRSMPGESARMAIVVITIAPIACAYPFFQRYFVSGLTIGAIKG